MITASWNDADDWWTSIYNFEIISFSIASAFVKKNININISFHFSIVNFSIVINNDSSANRNRHLLTISWYQLTTRSLTSTAAIRRRLQHHLSLDFDFRRRSRFFSSSRLFCKLFFNQNLSSISFCCNKIDFLTFFLITTKNVFRQITTTSYSIKSNFVCKSHFLLLLFSFDNLSFTFFKL